MRKVRLNRRTFDWDDADWYFMNTDITVKSISELLGCTKAALHKYYHANFPEQFRKERFIECNRRANSGTKNNAYGLYGKDHPKYTGCYLDGTGYAMISKPDWYTGPNKGKQIRRHHYEYCLANGLTEIPEGYVVHHIDLDTTNNEPDNLELLTRGEHTSLHRQLTEAKKCQP